jgi:RNA polymerase sigma-70 factor (ECF subfamily)
VSKVGIINILNWAKKAKYNGLSDSELCKLVSKSNDVAFSVIYERYKLDAFNYALSILKDKARATDATHDAFLKFYEKRKSYNEEGKFKAYFFRIIRNRCFDILKKKTEVLVENEIELEFSSKDDAIFDEVLTKMTLAELDTHFYKLDDLDREIFILWIKGFSMKEISEISKMKESFVKTKIHRIKKKFIEIGTRDE